MTPEQKIQWVVLNLNAKWDEKPAPDVTVENIDELYEAVDAILGSQD